MINLIDTSVWIDFVRAKSPVALKRMAYEHIVHKSAHLAEPIVFEMLKHALPGEMHALNEQFDLLPMLDTPRDLWRKAAELGQACRRRGHTAGSIDLLIAQVTLANRAVLLTFEEDFMKISEITGLQVNLLRRP